MISPSSVAANFAAALFLLRERPESAAEHECAVHALQACLSGDRVELKAGDALHVNGERVPDAAPGARDCHDVLAGHGIAEMGLPAAPGVTLLLALLRGLAAPATTYREFVAQLDEDVVRVLRLVPTNTATVALDDFVPGNDLMTAIGGRAATQAVELVARDRATPERLDGVLEWIAAAPADEAVPQWLNEVVAGVDAAVEQGNWTRVLRAMLVLVEAEEAAQGTVAGRAYGVAIRRVATRNVVEHLARMTASSTARSEAITVLRRLGAEATEVLLACLAAGKSLEERRAFYGALKQMTEGTQLLVNMLSHQEWYVVRNVADLCGELKLEEAVPTLAAQLKHTDERVRRSVAGALARIMSPAAVEPLRQALRDESPTVRLQALRGLEGWKARGLAMTLSLLVDEEPVPELQREILLALGRIGSPEAVQALGRAAAPGRRLFNRKAISMRLAAVEGLRLAGGAAAGAALQPLLGDDDPEVRAAAQKAVAAMAE